MYSEGHPPLWAPRVFIAPVHKMEVCKAKAHEWLPDQEPGELRDRPHLSLGSESQAQKPSLCPVLSFNLPAFRVLSLLPCGRLSVTMHAHLQVSACFFCFLNVYFGCTSSWLQLMGSSSLTRDRTRPPALGAWRPPGKSLPACSAVRLLHLKLSASLQPEHRCLPRTQAPPYPGRFLAGIWGPD